MRRGSSSIEDDDTEVILAQHATQLQSLSETSRSTNEKLDRVSNELHALTNSIAALIARPTLNASTALTVVLQAGALIAFAVSGILYVNQAFLSGDLHDLKSTDLRLAERLDSQRDRLMRLEKDRKSVV